MKRTSAWIGTALLTLAIGEARANDYPRVVAATAGMVSDGEAQRLAQRYGLQVMNVTWEDTGRSKGSSVGPNISDMTIQVAQKDPRTGRVGQLQVVRCLHFKVRGDELGGVDGLKRDSLLGPLGHREQKCGLLVRRVPR